MASVPLVLRTRFPLTAWGASALTIIGTDVVLPSRLQTTSEYIPSSLVVYGLCLYAVTVRCQPRIVLLVVVLTELGTAVIEPRSFAAAFFLTAIPLLARGSRPHLAQRREQAGRAGAAALRRTGPAGGAPAHRPGTA